MKPGEHEVRTTFLPIVVSVLAMVMSACSNGKVDEAAKPRTEAAKSLVEAKPSVEAVKQGGSEVKQALMAGLDVHLPPGWVQLASQGGPTTYAPRSDDSAGVLQVSRMPDEDYSFIAGHGQLGPFAADIGARLGWGTALEHKDMKCSMGRLGLAPFAGKEFPAMFVFVTVSEHSAYMWTWIAPNAQADEVKKALQIVVGATEAKLPSNPVVDEFVAALDKISLVRAEMLKGSSPEQLHLALFTDSDGKVSGDERPVLSGRFSIMQPSTSPPANQKVLLLQSRLDADQAQVLVIALVMKGDVERGRFVDTFTGKETDIGAQGKVNVLVTRNQTAAPSHPARLRAAQLWSLIGDKIDVPYQPAAFDATVLGTQLVKTSAPTNFENPGKGAWVLLKATSPDELYVAFDVAAGIVEFFPKTPMQPNEAARALFRAL